MATTTIKKDNEQQNEQQQGQGQTTKYIPVPPARVQQAVMVANVTIRGLKPLLMSSDKEMHLSEIESPIKQIKIKGSKTNPKVEAEKRAYRRDDHGWKGPLGIPAKCAKRNLVTAVKLADVQTEKGKKRGGISTVEKIKGSVNIWPEFIPLIHTDGSPVEDYIVNSEKVRIGPTKGSIIRYRPQIDDWALRFQVRWNPHLYGVSPGIIEHLLDKGGYLGLLDNRPEFGIFDLVEFKLDAESVRMAAEIESGRAGGDNTGEGEVKKVTKKISTEVVRKRSD